MNHAVVVDANVAIKWVVHEEHTEQARALLADSARALRPIVAPPHLPVEVTNAIYQKLSRRDLTNDEAEEALARFFQFRIELVAPPDLYQSAFAFARAYNLQNSYDSIYVVLARWLDTELWTGDRALLHAVRAAAPWVRWIGDYRA